MSTSQAVIISSVLETLTRLYSDVSYELAPAIYSGLFVGGCTVVGGLIGGRFGLLIGGSIGSGLSSYFGRKIVTLRQMIQELSTTQLQTLFALLSEAIISIVVTVLNRRVDNNSHLANLLEMFGGNSVVRSRVLQILTDFFISIHGDRLNSMAA